MRLPCKILFRVVLLVFVLFCFHALSPAQVIEDNSWEPWKEKQGTKILIKRIGIIHKCRIMTIWQQKSALGVAEITNLPNLNNYKFSDVFFSNNSNSVRSFMKLRKFNLKILKFWVLTQNLIA